MSAPLVSVYIVNHNYGRFLEQSIESVLQQTMRDFELIVIDDGSTDGSREIIERYEASGAVMAIFQQNQGLTVTNNIALRAAQGRYIMRLDADDYLERDALLVLSHALEQDPRVGLVFPDYYLVDDSGQVLEAVRRHDFREVKLLDQPANGACTMIRRDCLLALQGYDESVRCQDGYDLWVRLIQEYEVRNVNLPLFYYRRHGSNLTNNEARLLDARSRILEKQAAHSDRPLQVVAVIPARGRVSDPNSATLRTLGGRPLIDWTIEAALGAKRISEVVVTSPDDDVLRHVRDGFASRVIAVKRDRKLARLNTGIRETLQHALEQQSGPAADAVAVLYIESPFRAGAHIDSAVHVMEVFGTDMVVGVRQEADTFYRHEGAGLVPLRRTKGLRLEREELYRAAGHLTLMKRALVEREPPPDEARVGHVVLDEVAAFAIKGEWDWQLAEFSASRLGLAVQGRQPVTP